jgi:iron only hydrogenase large subunit-like protein
LKALVEIIDDKCTVCYACVRECPVDAIQVRAQHPYPRIVPERCIGCGSCIDVCHPDAIRYLDSRQEALNLLKSETPVAALLDPSIAGEFPDITDYRKFVRMIRELGFKLVVEVSFGVDLLTRAYTKLFKEFRGKYYVMANCPVVINYVQKYQPELLANLAPIVSPAMATAKMLRKKYGADYKVVYIGPLIAHKSQSERGEDDGLINSVLTFTELRSLFAESAIDEKQVEFSDFDPPAGYKGALFPIANGFVQAAGLNDDLLTGNITTVEGKPEMKEALKEFLEKIEKIKSHFNIFYTEYLMGAGTSKQGQKYIRQANVKEYARKRLKNFNVEEWEKSLTEFANLDLSRKFNSDDQRLPYPDDKKIKDILKDLKQDSNGQSGCGACGYNSCRDFAVAIARGIAIPEMCKSYTARNRQDYIQSLKISNEKLAQTEQALRESEKSAQKEKEIAREASDIVNAMLQKLPSGIVILNEKLKILQANQSFIELLGNEAREINDIIPGLAGADLKTLLPYNIYNLFSYVLANNETIQNRDINFGDRLLNVSVFIIRKGKSSGLFYAICIHPRLEKKKLSNG